VPIEQDKLTEAEYKKLLIYQADINQLTTALQMKQQAQQDIFELACAVRGIDSKTHQLQMSTGKIEPLPEVKK
jgi:hypothetical protein